MKKNAEVVVMEGEMVEMVVAVGLMEETVNTEMEAEVVEMEGEMAEMVVAVVLMEETDGES